MTSNKTRKTIYTTSKTTRGAIDKALDTLMGNIAKPKSKTLIAMPCSEMMHSDTAFDLISLRRVGDTRVGHTKMTMIHDARNTFAERAINEGYDRVLWIDSDMRFGPDVLERLSADMDVLGMDYVSALCFKRVYPTAPVIYDDMFQLSDAPGMYGVHIYRDYPKDQLFKIAASGFGCVLTSVQLLKDVWDNFGPPFNYVANLGEDMSFCYKVAELGVDMWCDSSVKVGHIGGVVFSESTYQEQLNSEQTYQEQSNGEQTHAEQHESKSIKEG